MMGTARLRGQDKPKICGVGSRPTTDFLSRLYFLSARRINGSVLTVTGGDETHRFQVSGSTNITGPGGKRSPINDCLNQSLHRRQRALSSDLRRSFGTIARFAASKIASNWQDSR